MDARDDREEASSREEVMRTIPRRIFRPLSVPAPEHWRGLLHVLGHSRALHIRDATGARFPLTPADCKRKCDRSGLEAKAVRIRLWRRDQRFGFVRCHWCGEALTREQVTKDHVVARCFGGSDILANIVPACRRCNNRRSIEQARIMEELRLEWTIAELRLVA